MNDLSRQAAPETLLELMQRDLEAWIATKAAIAKAKTNAPSAGQPFRQDQSA